MAALVPIPTSFSTPFHTHIRCSCPNPTPPHHPRLRFNSPPNLHHSHPITLRLRSPYAGFSIPLSGEDIRRRRNERLSVLVRLNRFNGGNGGSDEEGANVRTVGNFVLGVGLTYLTLTGQLGWVFDALFSIWIVAFLVPIVGFGAFVWWAGQDMIQSTCPNCKSDFQIFRSMINDELLLCPYCSQPFSVVDDEFVREGVQFSNETTNFAQSFNGFSKKSKKGKKTSQAIVDVEAEVTDAD